MNVNRQAGKQAGLERKKPKEKKIKMEKNKKCEREQVMVGPGGDKMHSHDGQTIHVCTDAAVCLFA